MFARRLAAWWVYLALTAPIGLLAHFAFEAYGRRDGGFSPFELDHLALMGVIVCSIVAAIVSLRRGSRDERRLRLAQLRQAVPRGTGLVAATCAVQLGVAAGTLAVENLNIDPTHVACALVLGIATAFLGARVFLHAEETILTVAAALDLAATQIPAARHLAAASDALPPAGRIAARLHRGRAPPLRP
jgi:hypothetical protein